MNSSAAELPADEAPASLWEDFLDIFYEPRQVFARRSAGRWGLVLLILTILTALIFYASQSVLGPLFDAEFTRAMQRNPSVTPEQIAQARKMSGLFGLVGIVVSFPIGIMLSGLLLWGIGKLFDSVATLSIAILIATYAQIPRILQGVVTLVQGLVLDVRSMDSLYAVSLSPARFLNPDTTSAVLMAIAGRFDLFVLWSTLLLAIGLEVLGRVPRVQAYIAAGIVWLLGALPVLIGALSGSGAG